MKRAFNTSLVIAALILATAAPSGAVPAKLTVAVNKPGHAISPMLYGIFFEDINCSADGGIYAEMVRNRNFEDSDKPDHWSVLADGPATVEMGVDSAHPVSPKNPHSLKVRPVTLTLKDAGAAFRHTFPANSVTVLRLKLQ